jgi:hypothetical protein
MGGLNGATEGNITTRTAKSSLHAMRCGVHESHGVLASQAAQERFAPSRRMQSCSETRDMRRSRR